MLNVVVPIANNAKKFRKILNSLINVKDVNVFVGVVSSQIDELNMINGDNIYKIEYQDNSNREEIINSLQKYLDYGEILIMRKPITVNEFNSFLSTNKDVVVCRQNHSSVKVFFKNLWQKILKLCLGVKLYDGDTSVIYFAQDIATVILGSTNLSYNSRVDRWKGIEQGSVIVEGDKVNTEKDKKLNLKNLFISILVFSIGAVVTTVVCLFAPVNIIVGLLLFCLDVICLLIIAILFVMTLFNNTVGKKNFGFAAEIEQEIDYEDGSEDVESGYNINGKLLKEMPEEKENEDIFDSEEDNNNEGEDLNE